jgi:NTE family protein
MTNETPARKRPARGSRRRGKAGRAALEHREAAGAAKTEWPSEKPRNRGLPAHCAEVGLVLQGGGALGAYQAGVYEALAEREHYLPDWIAGISIGAINGAIIAGNPPSRRVEKLRAFWELVSERITAKPFADGDYVRGFFNEWSALASVAAGIPGFYRPRMPPAWLQPWGTEGALSFYDTSPLRATLEALVDFDLLNAKGGAKDGAKNGTAPRLSIGAANIRKGNSVYFDSGERRIGPEHVMASAALPPGFPPVEIEGEHYWDGGVLSNTPLDYVLDSERDHSTLVFQVDLFSARGTMPRNLLDVYERHKDILYSSRTRKNTSAFGEVQLLRQAVEQLIKGLPAAELEKDYVKAIEKRLRDSTRSGRKFGESAPMSVVHLIYREKYYETQAKDYEFSRVAMEEHWQAGLNDTRRTLRHEELWLEKPGEMEAVRTFDITRDFD